MNTVELLSPAGDFECLKAAVQNGADCVYLGASMFSARASAGNFNLEELKSAIEYAKIRNVKTNLTLNILIKNEEFKQAVALATAAYEYGIDAIIVQDLGLAKYLISNFPDLPIHASTQMTIYNLEGALQAEKLGFKRAVLAREVPLEEIKNICENTNIEIEVFIHGALCISYSGQCLLSSIIGGRSGNRGKCAQPCRLPYKLCDSDNSVLDSGYLLSTRDLCSLENIPVLLKAGVKSFKIEGRMKPVTYVATVTRIYRKYIDLAYSNKPYIIEEQDKKDLLQVFNRGGSSSGHLNTEANTNLIFAEKPNNMGLFLGTVHDYNSSRGYITLKLCENLAIGDTISLEKETGTYTISELMQNDKNIPNATSHMIVKIGRMKGNISVGDKIFKISSKSINQQAELCLASELKKVELNCNITIKKNKPISITISGINRPESFYNDLDITIISEIVPVDALKSPITPDRIREQLSKTKNTPFEFTNIQIDLDDGLYIPSISALNELRRNALAKLEQTMLEKYKKTSTNSLCTLNTNCNNSNSDTKISVLFNKLNLDTNYLELKNIDNVYIPYKYFINSQYNELLNKFCNTYNVYIYMPLILKNSHFDFDEILSKYTIKGFVVSNISQYELLDKYKNYEFIGNYSLNIFNNYSSEELYSLGFNKFTISPELDKSSINNICSSISSELIAYGNLPVMNTNYCLLGKSNKCYGNCSKKCKTSEFYLKDRLNYEFKIIPENGITTIYNSKITSIDTSDIKVSNLRIDFLTEDVCNMQIIIDTVKNRRKLEGNIYTNGNISKEI